MISPLFEIGDEVKSKRDEKLSGFVIGYGTLQWNSDEDVEMVYLVQTSQKGSSSLGPAVAVFSADQTLAIGVRP